MNKEKWYKRDDVEYWKKEYLKLSKQLEEKQIVLDKIKEYCNNRLQYYNEMKRDYDLEEFDGNAENDNENILELLEENNE